MLDIKLVKLKLYNFKVTMDFLYMNKEPNILYKNFHDDQNVFTI